MQKLKKTIKIQRQNISDEIPLRQAAAGIVILNYWCILIFFSLSLGEQVVYVSGH
jgi:hypothetical protein